MKPNGTKKRQLSDFGNFPDLSPDGSQIAFSGAPNGSTNIDIFVINVDDGTLTRLTTAPGQDQFPAWSPDGTKLPTEATCIQSIPAESSSSPAGSRAESTRRPMSKTATTSKAPRSVAAPSSSSSQKSRPPSLDFGRRRTTAGS
jgi:Tol biopolymer transport system component